MDLFCPFISLQFRKKTHSIAVSICFASLLTREEKNLKRSTNKNGKTGSNRKYRFDYRLTTREQLVRFLFSSTAYFSLCYLLQSQFLGQRYSPILTRLKKKYYHRIGHRFLVYSEIYFHPKTIQQYQCSIAVSNSYQLCHDIRVIM